ncbi:PPE family protein [Mycobacterium vicinigordonae]|uniref:PPE family protein n=1 Tax=Mycobacterium vicinigordonae TaxID=1719132 RepID=A0A7D6HR32_9MYCO|nr:PPE family protein [Mycobacterium vicinigordonae]QLL05292.1 PPE family protein [Mycobacterium vicinigordonae]
MVDYGLLPPEINSGRIYTGPGAGPLLAAASAWSGLSADLHAAAAGHRSVITELTGGPWLGPASKALVSAVTPFIAWLESSGDEAALAASQSYAAAGAYETAFASSVPPPVIAANRALLAALIATNFLGQNTPAIAATEAVYAEFWAQDAAAMYNYAGSAAAATQLNELPEPAEVADPASALDQAIAVFKGAGQAVQAQLNNVGSQLAPRIGEVLQTLSSPLNGQGPAIDQWIVANTPLDDIVPLYSKYISPYVSTIAAFETGLLAFSNEASGMSAIVNVFGGVTPAAEAAKGAAQAAGAAATGAATKVGSVAAGVGRAIPLGGLSVPASWTTTLTGATGPAGVTAASNTTALPAAVEAAAATGNTPVAPPFGQFINAGNGRKTPSYGFRLTFMTRPPAAG